MPKAIQATTARTNNPDNERRWRVTMDLKRKNEELERLALERIKTIANLKEKIRKTLSITKQLAKELKKEQKKKEYYKLEFFKEIDHSEKLQKRLDKITKGKKTK